MTTEKYGFVYIWFDRKSKKFYVGSHWGTEDDGYICSSRMMRQSYNRRTDDFKRRTLSRIYTNRKDLLIEEERWLMMIDPNKTTTKHTTETRRKENVRYYNINLGTQNHWWSDIDASLTIGEKISKAKTGKSTGPCSPEKAKAISNAKKASFKKKIEQNGSAFTEEHKEKISQSKIGTKRSEEAKRKTSESMKKDWKLGVRKRATLKQSMSREDQNSQSSSRLKQLWADPVWAENQRKKLSEGAKNRPPRSEESKRKASLAQKNIPKPRLKIEISGTSTDI